MTDLNRALVEIGGIRRQLARTMEFRGYGPVTLWATAVAAAGAGLAQAHWVPAPAAQPWRYTALWLTTGVLCAALIATEMLARASRLHAGMAGEMVRMAVTQFLPAAVAGVALPFVLPDGAAGGGGSVVWMLPGWWQVVFGLGVFASCRCLPGAMNLVGAWFLLTGLGCLALGDARALSPVAMAGPYAVGMGMAAAVHARGAERGRVDDGNDE